MSLGIAQILEPTLRDRRTRFVFPSGIAADFWLARSLRIGQTRAVEAGRFMGWDRFKELSSREEADERPADEALRWIFAAHLLAKNAEAPFLRSILPREHAERYSPFIGYLASRLS